MIMKPKYGHSKPIRRDVWLYLCAGVGDGEDVDIVPSQGLAQRTLRTDFRLLLIILRGFSVVGQTFLPFLQNLFAICNYVIMNNCISQSQEAIKGSA
jgi:hypothetical protein